tara:strand:- start:643 stop:783 length:141 start_codon:yes stop_codon:yes gene_type:complete
MNPNNAPIKISSYKTKMDEIMQCVDQNVIDLRRKTIEKPRVSIRRN